MKIEGNIVDVVNEDIFPAEIDIRGNRILEIKKVNKNFNRFILPGFVDAHIHIESSMLCPSRFAEVVIPHGTVSVIADAHEIANVMGIEGILFMIEDSKNTPLKAFFTAPSCVPATPFETNGGTISEKEVEKLFELEKVVALGEVMNYEAVINGEKEMIAKIEIAKKYGKVIDGHAPLLSGKKLETYISYGITTDHESVSYEEAKEKAKLGMKIMIREGSNAKNMKDLINLIKEGYETFLVSDDILVSDLIKGHLDRLLSSAVELGIDPVKAIKCVTVNPVKHYRIPVGLLRKGDYADLIIVNNLKEFRVIEVYIEGKLVAKDGKATFNVRPKSTGNTLIAKPLELNMIKIRGEGKKQKVNVIGIIPDQIVTDHLIEELETKDGYLESDQEKDILKIIVYERYGHGNLSIGFIKGFGFKNCALASTIAHDSHNIVCAGSSNDLIVKAVNNLIEKGGGVCAVDKSNVEILPLPIAGLMSNEEANIVAENIEKIHEFLALHECRLTNPIITLSFMTLLVIPKLKISDRGLFDVEKQEFIPLLVSK